MRNNYFRMRAAFFRTQYSGSLCPHDTTRVLGSATQGHARARQSRTVLNNTLYMKTTWANLFRKACLGYNEADEKPKLPYPTYSIFRQTSVEQHTILSTCLLRWAREIMKLSNWKRADRKGIIHLKEGDEQVDVVRTETSARATGQPSVKHISKRPRAIIRDGTSCHDIRS